MVIASNAFRDEEYLEPRALFDEAGADVTVASSSADVSEGMLGALVTPDVLLKDTSSSNYDAVVFVGGNGAREYWNNPVAHSLAKNIASAGKVVAAICIAPVILANANLLVAKKATVFNSEQMRLRSRGATLTGNPVEREGNIITASGPAVASEFAETIIQALAE